MSDFLIASAEFSLAASKNKTYQEHVKVSFKTLIKFLDDNALLVNKIIYNEINNNTKIMKSDLTKEGFDLVAKALDKWFSAQDRGKAPDDTTILERELKKIRK